MIEFSPKFWLIFTSFYKRNIQKRAYCFTRCSEVMTYQAALTTGSPRERSSLDAVSRVHQLLQHGEDIDPYFQRCKPWPFVRNMPFLLTFSFFELSMKATSWAQAPSWWMQQNSEHRSPCIALESHLGAHWIGRSSRCSQLLLYW